MPTWMILVAFAMGWIFTLTSVALGGYLVFRTKKEPHEVLFSGQPKGTAFNLDEFQAEPDPEEDPVMEIVRSQNARFRQQMAKGVEQHG